MDSISFVMSSIPSGSPGEMRMISLRATVSMAFIMVRLMLKKRNGTSSNLFVQKRRNRVRVMSFPRNVVSAVADLATEKNSDSNSESLKRYSLRTFSNSASSLAMDLLAVTN